MDIPEYIEPQNKPEYVYVWTVGGENPCDVCEMMDGTLLDDDHVPKPHPNCNCFATKMPKEDFDKKYGGADAKKQEKLQELYVKEKEWQMKVEEKDKNFEIAYEKLKEPEGGYTDGKNQNKDEPTNMGIKQSTLDNYSAKHPDKYFPKDVKNLQPEQAKEIYKNEYWNNTKIPNIENDRIRNAVFDMNVVGSAGAPTQRALNSYMDADIKVDGVIGLKETIKVLNSIPDNKVSEFMDVLKSERMNTLRGLKNWSTAKGGWTKRTMAY